MSDCEQNFQNKSWRMLIDDERYLQQLDMKYIWIVWMLKQTRHAFLPVVVRQNVCEQVGGA